MGYVARTISTTASLGAPTWWTDLADKTWAVICKGTGSDYSSGNTLRQAMPHSGISGVDNTLSITAYSGATVDHARGRVLITGGGDLDYAGNEVIALSLRTATPGWARLCDPSPGAYSTGPLTKNGQGQYPIDRGKNGSPAASHTYHRLCFANDRMWLPGAAAQHPSNAATSRIFWFDCVTNKWAAGSYMVTDADAAYYNGTWFEQGASVYIDAQNAIYAEITQPTGGGSPPRVIKIDASTGAILKTWTSAQVDGFCTGTAYAIPGTNYAVGRTHFDGSGKMYLFNFGVDPPTRTQITPGGAAATAGWQDDRFGGAWHPATGGLVLGLGGGETFVKLVPNSVGNYSGAWTATLVSPANVGNPSRIIPPSDNPYNRYTIVNDMGDGRSALVYQPSNTSSPTYVMALPAAGL